VRFGWRVRHWSTSCSLEDLTFRWKVGLASLDDLPLLLHLSKTKGCWSKINQTVRKTWQLHLLTLTLEASNLSTISAAGTATTGTTTSVVASSQHRHQAAIKQHQLQKSTNSWHQGSVRLTLTVRLLFFITPRKKGKANKYIYNIMDPINGIYNDI